MKNSKAADRLYNEKEIGALIHRATELYAEAKGASGSSLSIKEIEQIAAELGLPSMYIRAAVLEREGHQDSQKAFSLWGGPFILEQVRLVNEEITEEKWAQAVSEIRNFTGNRGRINEGDYAREWERSTEDMGLIFEKTTVTMISEDGQTSIRVQKRYGGVVFLAYLISGVIGVTLTGIALDGGGLSDLINFTLAVCGGVGALALVRSSVSLWARRQRKHLKKLADSLYNLYSSTPSSKSTPSMASGQIEFPKVEQSEDVPFKNRNRTR